MTHIDLLKQHDACDDAVEWASQYPDFADAWDACQQPGWMLWLHDEGIITISDRDMRLFACDCVRHTPTGGGRTVWDLLTDERSRHAVEVAERYANGEAMDYELIAAEKVARAAAWEAAAWAVARAASAWDAAGVATRAAAWYAARAAAGAAAGAAARAAAAEAAARAAAAEASAWAFQADLLRKRIGNPFEGGHEL